jgi:hypothetical protein
MGSPSLSLDSTCIGCVKAHRPIPLGLPHRREFLRLTLATSGGVSLGSFLAACGGGGNEDSPAALTAGSAPASASSHSLVSSPATAKASTVRSPFETMSELQPADANGVMLPLGFSSRIVARSGEPPLPGKAPWHGAPDGGACFAAPDGGWIYVSNCELGFTSDLHPAGGAGALRFDKSGVLIDSYPILRNTVANCAGGATPWGTWLSCEEFELVPRDRLQQSGRSAGLVWECDPFSPWVDGQAGRSFSALGRFAHEAICVDPVQRALYMTEDADGGRFYRFVCDPADWPAGAARPRLELGRLQVLQVRGLRADAEVVAAATASGLDLARPCPVDWVDVRRPDEGQGFTRQLLKLLGADPPGTEFVKCEGTWYFNGVVYFATQNNHRIWAYDSGNQTLEFIYEGSNGSTDPMKFAVNRPDNITVTPLGEIIATEDGGNLEIGVLRADRTSKAIARLVGHDASETTGPALSPDGTRLYFSSQRGTTGRLEGGVTFELILPSPAR